MGSKLSAMGVSGVGNRLVGGGMSGHRNSISFDRSGEYYKQLTRTGINDVTVKSFYGINATICLI